MSTSFLTTRQDQIASSNMCKLNMAFGLAKQVLAEEQEDWVSLKSDIAETVWCALKELLSNGLTKPAFAAIEMVNSHQSFLGNVIFRPARTISDVALPVIRGESRSRPIDFLQLESKKRLDDLFPKTVGKEYYPLNAAAWNIIRGSIGPGVFQIGQGLALADEILPRNNQESELLRQDISQLIWKVLGLLTKKGGAREAIQACKLLANVDGHAGTLGVLTFESEGKRDLPSHLLSTLPKKEPLNKGLFATGIGDAYRKWSMDESDSTVSATNMVLSDSRAAQKEKEVP